MQLRSAYAFFEKAMSYQSHQYLEVLNMQNHIHHAHLFASDLDATLKFYQEMFGGRFPQHMTLPIIDRQRRRWPGRRGSGKPLSTPRAMRFGFSTKTSACCAPTVGRGGSSGVRWRRSLACTAGRSCMAQISRSPNAPSCVRNTACTGRPWS